jgi:hypothetical protein
MSNEPKSVDSATNEPHFPNVDGFEVLNMPSHDEPRVGHAVRVVYSLAKSSEWITHPSQFKWADKRNMILRIQPEYEGTEAFAKLLNEMVPNCCVLKDGELEVNLKAILRQGNLFKHMDSLAVGLAKPEPYRTM